MLSENIVEDKQQVDKLYGIKRITVPFISVGCVRQTLRRAVPRVSRKLFPLILRLVATLTITTQGSNYQLHTTSLETITNNSKKTVSEAEKIATKLASQTFQVTKKQKKNLPIVVIDYDSTDKMQHNLLDQERQDQEHQDQEQEHRITRDVGDTSVTQTQNEETSFWQIVEGIKNCLAQNKEIF
ncbi:uncharacterized protein OCT59_017649 [Rhizophagus irregularis]|uniref:uncharacterized protein n=1 Tax=Rhizophagus irregularis TaxID=588596 RepID=UPI00332D2360|nr:hypothetical protein OCT59_017649 [Rhizophagus irregularis]